MEERLRKFVQIVDYGSYTLASKKMHISQPALTIAVQKLEKELGVALLNRASKNLSLTEAGKLAYTEGARLIESSQRLQNRLQRLQQQKIPLRLGCVDSIADLLVANRLLELLEERYTITMTIQSSGQLKQRFSQKELDIVLYVASEHSENNAVVLDKEKLCFVTTEKPSKKQSTYNNFLAYNQESTTYRHITDLLAKDSISIKPILYSTNPTILLALALQGKGQTVLPETIVAKHIAQGTLQIIPTSAKLARPINALVNPALDDTNISRFLRAIKSELKHKKAIKNT